MKIGIIGANGNLGKKVTKCALERGYEVKTFIYNGELPYKDVEVVQKNLFDMEREEIKDVDVLISTFGSGFKVDPIINYKAFLKYIELLKDTNKKLIAVAGAGCLYTDKSHTLREYETPQHSEKLRGISKNNLKGIQELEKSTIEWCTVSPSRYFDLNGGYTGDYIVGNQEEIIFNEDGESYLTYDDMACAILDIVDSNNYVKKNLTFATRKKV